MGRMKNRLIIFAICSVAIALWMLSPGGLPKGNESGELKLGVFYYNYKDTFIYSMKTELEVYEREVALVRNTPMTVLSYDAKGKQDLQLDQIDEALRNGCNCLAVNIVDTTFANIVIEKARERNVPVIFFNRELFKEDMAKWEKLYYVGTESSEAGILQGEMIYDYCQKNDVDRNHDGILQYVLLEGELPHKDAIARTQYAVTTLEQNGLTLEKLATDSGNWLKREGEEKMNLWLDAFGDNIELVISNNDDMALGAIEAMKTHNVYSGRYIPIFGVDATEPAIKSLENGYLTGTILNDASGQMRGVVDIAYYLATERDPKQSMPNISKNNYLYIPYKKVIRENVHQIIQ